MSNNIAIVEIKSIEYTGDNIGRNYELVTSYDDTVQSNIIFEQYNGTIILPEPNTIFALEYTGDTFYAKLSFAIKQKDQDPEIKIENYHNFTFDLESIGTETEIHFPFTIGDLNSNIIMSLNQTELDKNPHTDRPELDCICKASKKKENFPSEIKDRFSDFLSGIFYTNVNSLITVNNEWGWSTCDYVQAIKDFLSSFSEDGELTTEQANALRNIIIGMRAFENSLPPDFPSPCEDARNFGTDSKGIQSSSLYIQSVGSTGGDGTVAGAHIRWALMKDLGKKHLPKGNNLQNVDYATIAGYSNNPDDYIKLYRVKYDNLKIIELDLRSSISNYSTENISSDSAIWIIDSSFYKKICLKFNNIDLYLSLKNSIDPLINPKNFIYAYCTYNIASGGQMNEVEIGIDEYLCFSTEFEVVVDSSTSVSSPVNKLLSYESISVIDIANDSDILISSREEINTINGQTTPYIRKIFVENIKYVRFSCRDNGKINFIRFETYYDFITTRNWDIIDNFALSLDDSIVNDRLQNIGNSIDKVWPKYNGGVLVNINNYINSGSTGQTIDKWTASQSNDGIKDAIKAYLTLSKDPDNLIALDSLAEISPTSNGQIIQIKYLEILKLISMDFHIARMLGLGYIDTFPDTDRNNKYVYLAYYKAPQFEGADGNVNYYEHKFMSLPTDVNDTRLPIQPQLDNFTFTVPFVDNCTTEEIVDVGGYFKNEELRVININRQKYNYELEKSIEGFFESPQKLFNLGETTKPVSYGIEYGSSSTTYFSSELPNHDNILPSPYKDYLNFSSNDPDIEEITIVNDKPNPIFTYFEKVSGVWHYALYGVNWFSRVSPLSSDVSLDTEFTNLNLKAPIDVKVQYIQEEDPIVLTSQSEQSVLSTLSEDDKYWTRLTFNWNHLQNISSNKANKIRIYYRTELPKEIQGAINTVIDDLDGSSWVTTKNFDLVSVYPKQTLIPVVNSGEEPKFINSYLNTHSGRFRITNVQPNDDGTIKFKIQNNVEVKSIQTSSETDLYSHYEPRCTFTVPKAGEYFNVVENLAEETSWTKLQKEISIVRFTNNPNITGEYTEDVVDGEGNIFTLTLGGIYRMANVSLINGNDVNGLYKIIFSSFVLDKNPNNEENVELYNGVVRIKTTKNRYRALEVWKTTTENNGADFVLYAFDASYNAAPDSEVILDGSLNVNYHPGYRVYLKPESSSFFTKSTLLPSADQRSKQTLVGLASHNIVHDKTSPVSIPAALVALSKQIPLPPTLPLGASYTTRPDYYGKSSYTFDIETGINGHYPFSILVYRCDLNTILKALYMTTTIDSIYAKLAELGALQNNFNNNRISDLVNVSLDESSSTFEFREFSDDATYRLPVPDLETLSGTISEKQDKLRKKINELFIALTFQPCIYQFIEPGTQTENTKPLIRDINGNLLDASAAKPFPFIRKFSKIVSGNTKDYIRFTDYNIDGSTNNLYFYFTKEVSNELKTSDRSPISQPIRTINTYPSESPLIKKVEIVNANSYLETKDSIRFEISDYLDSDKIKKIRLYRLLDETIYESNAQALTSIRNMNLVNTFEIGDEIKDSFDDMAFPPYEDNIYYRLEAIREIKNEQNNIELVPSKPSKLLKLKVAATINPDSPEIVIESYNSTTSNSSALKGLQLSWKKTTYKGNYILYKLTANGVWQNIYQIESDSANIITPILPDLALLASNGKPVYHIFKVSVQNRSGLFNLDGIEFNLTNCLIPNPRISGPKIICKNQNAVYTTPNNQNAVYAKPNDHRHTFSWVTPGATVVSGANTHEITLLWGNSQSFGVKELILTETNDLSVSIVNKFKVNLKPIPAPNISTSDTFLIYKEGTFTTPYYLGNDYLWEVDGGVITAGQGTNTITVYWDTPGDKNVSVAENNGTVIEVASNIQFIPTPYISINQKPYINNSQTIFTIHNVPLSEDQFLDEEWTGNVNCDLLLNELDYSSANFSWQGLGNFEVQFRIRDYFVQYTGKVLPVPITRTLPLVEGCDFDNLGFYRKLHKYKILNLFNGNNNPLITDIIVENGELLYDLTSIITNINNGSISFIDIFWGTPDTSNGALTILDSDINDPTGQEYITQIGVSFGESREMIVGNSNAQFGNTDIYTIEFGYYDTTATYVWEIDDPTVGQITSISATTISIDWLKSNAVATISLNNNIIKRSVNILDQNIRIDGNTSPHPSTSETYTISGSNINPNSTYLWELDDSFISSGAITINSTSSTDINLGFNTPGVFRILLKEVDTLGTVNYYEKIISVI